MEHSFFDIIKGTPLWVWVLFAYVLIKGFRASKTRTVPIYQLPIMPLIFTLWSFFSVYGKYGLSAIAIMVWMISCALGLVLGFYISKKQTVTINREKNVVTLPGSFIPLILAISFFAVKYFIGVTYALDPSFKTNVFFYGADMIMSGMVSGVSWARLISIMKVFKTKTS